MRQTEEEQTPLLPTVELEQCPHCSDPTDDSPCEHRTHKRGAR